MYIVDFPEKQPKAHFIELILNLYWLHLLKIRLRLFTWLLAFLDFTTCHPYTLQQKWCHGICKLLLTGKLLQHSSD